MIATLTTALWILLIAWIFTEMEPIQTALYKLFKYFERKGNKFWRTLYCFIIYKVLSCWKCAAWWGGLILTQDILAALIASFVAYIVLVWRSK